MRIFTRFLLVAVLVSLLNQPGTTLVAAAPKGGVFETDVLPILLARCGRCHAKGQRKGRLDLGTLVGVRRGSESGAIVVPGKPEKSPLVEALVGGDMPPDGKNLPTKAEIAKITSWIRGGARTRAGGFDTGTRWSQEDVLPIFYTRCVVCHGSREKKGGLDLRTRASILKGGQSGPAVVPGKPDQSLLVKRIHAVEMPPPKLLVDFGIRTVEADELDTIRKWIASGAPGVPVVADVATRKDDPLVSNADRAFWSFRPPRKPAVPSVGNASSARRVANPIDAFLLRALGRRSLEFAAEADRLTLIRRVAFDLTGLPPSWNDIERYLGDDQPGGYRRMVDRFLADRHYGERWGRYWLDLAGYADSEGKRSADPIRPHAWRYRDYVIRAFNADKPYDRFLLEQIAGDELADYANAKTISPELMDNLVATGFLRMAPDGTGSDIVNTVVERFEVVVDEIDVLSSAVLGLTMKCAQCHSHKYDPIPQRDYYRLVAVFQGAYDVYDWLKPSFVPGQTKSKAVGRVLAQLSDDEQRRGRAARTAIEKRIADIQQELQDRQAKLLREYSESRLARLPDVLRDDLRQMLSVPTDKRTAVQKYLARKFEKQLTLTVKQLKKRDAAFKKLADSTSTEIKQLQATVPAEPRIRALWDRGEPSPTWLFRRGQFNKPGHRVGPGVPSVLTDGRTPFEFEPPRPGSRSTGRRLALARWLVAPDHPLTARVLVNRLWFHHFGRGLVETLSNFGNTGSRPSHPELLDWLARTLIEKDWSIKEMHRLMMTSSAYRQRSTNRPAAEQLDPENRLLWRMPLKRMEAEVIRDSILAVSGSLDDRPFGPPDAVDVRADGLVTSRVGPKGWRRSLYVQHRRKHMPTILETFDLPQMIPNCVERPDSTVAGQALHLMNDPMIRSLSDAFAERVLKDVGTESYQQVERVYQLALGRQPTAQERQLGQAALVELTRHWRTNAPKGGKSDPGIPPGTRALATYCHTVLNSAAFLFID
ncbi:MAG: hypothetical protein CMJ65_11855 [Planctomycetaceae bacterium]|jgi:cytochrome c553|nr:hypothetical protein [Planctomycetaceae bacterium]MDP7276082.1 PSD1 and planctomycete cytochrome C domain-containing protein [Planctomycetaceae bacterium]